MVDGRHTGTGGGNHVVVGGATPAGLALPAPARPAEEPRAHLLAAASVAVLLLLRPVHRPDEPGAAHRRGAPRRASTSSRLRISHGAEARRGRGASCPGWSTGCSGNLLVDIHRQHPPHRAVHRQAVLARRAHSGRLGLVEFRGFEMPPDAADERLPSSFSSAPSSPGSGSEPQDRASWCAGARRCTTASCCRISSGRISSGRARRPRKRAGYAFDPAWYRGAVRVPLSPRFGQRRPRAA